MNTFASIQFNMSIDYLNRTSVKNQLFLISVCYIN